MNRCSWNIQRSVIIAAEIGEVWRHVGEPEQVSLWWCPPPAVRIQFEPHRGGTYEERYRDSTYTYEGSGTVVGYEPPYRLAIQRRTSGRFGSMDCVEIVLTPDGDQTRINLTHSFEELPKELQAQAYDFFADGWSDSLKHLQQLVNKDCGCP